MVEGKSTPGNTQILPRAEFSGAPPPLFLFHSLVHRWVLLLLSILKPKLQAFLL